jgi:hypothetical protein
MIAYFSYENCPALPSSNKMYSEIYSLAERVILYQKLLEYLFEVIFTVRIERYNRHITQECIVSDF